MRCGLLSLHASASAGIFILTGCSAARFCALQPCWHSHSDEMWDRWFLCAFKSANHFLLAKRTIAFHALHSIGNFISAKYRTARFLCSRRGSFYSGEREAISFLRPRSAGGFILAGRRSCHFHALNAVVVSSWQVSRSFRACRAAIVFFCPGIRYDFPRSAAMAYFSCPPHLPPGKFFAFAQHTFTLFWGL